MKISALLFIVLLVMPSKSWHANWIEKLSIDSKKDACQFQKIIEKIKPHLNKHIDKDVSGPLLNALLDTLCTTQKKFSRTLYIKKTGPLRASLTQDTLNIMYRDPSLNRSTWNTIDPMIKQKNFFIPAFTVSYTHLTLPTILRV